VQGSAVVTSDKCKLAASARGSTVVSSARASQVQVTEFLRV